MYDVMYSTTQVFLTWYYQFLEKKKKKEQDNSFLELSQKITDCKFDFKTSKRTTKVTKAQPFTLTISSEGYIHQYSTVKRAQMRL